ncbi:MAG: hypothetical protein ACUVXI_13010, partial [bacterium]
MADITIDEKKLQELIDQEIEKRLRSRLDDVEILRKSPAGAIIRIEGEIETINAKLDTVATREDLLEFKNDSEKSHLEIISEMATKADLVALREANERAHAEMATKTDLVALKEANERAHAEMATKTDLVALKEANERAHAEMATKADLVALREANERAHAEMATKADLVALREANERA